MVKAKVRVRKQRVEWTQGSYLLCLKLMRSQDESHSVFQNPALTGNGKAQNWWPAAQGSAVCPEMRSPLPMSLLPGGGLLTR